MNRRDFLKLIAAFTTAPYLPKEFLMPTYNYSGDFYIKLLKDLYRKNGVTIPEADFATLQRLVDEERTRNEAVGSWQRVQDNRISASNLDLPFVPIYSEVLAKDVASLTINVPGTYTHLMIMGSARINNSGVGAVYCFSQFNDDTGASNYSHQLIYGINTSAGANQDLTHYGCLIGYITAEAVASGHAGSFINFIPHYNSSYYKNVLTMDGLFGETSASVALWIGQWKNTSPIRTITFIPETTYPGAMFEAGSIFSVYGIQ